MTKSSSPITALRCILPYPKNSNYSYFCNAIAEKLINATNLQYLVSLFYDVRTMSVSPETPVNLDLAVRVDRQLTDYFGESPLAAAPAPTTEVGLRTPFMNRVQSRRYQHNDAYGVVDVAANLSALRGNDSVGQVVGVRRTIIVQGKPITLINPGILQGASADGKGVAVTYLLDVLPRGEPVVTDRQDALLRTSVHLNHEGIGGKEADGIVARGKSTAAELGHTYMGLRVVTDPTLIQAIEARQHPVHSWAAAGGIATEVTSRNAKKPGMFDTVTDGRVRTTVPHQRTLYPGDGTELIVHSAYKGEANYGADVPPERVAIAIGIEAAQKTIGLQVEVAQTTMFRALASVNK
jgi:hypothetical protein